MAGLVNVRHTNGNSVLFAAVESGSFKAIKYIISLGACVKGYPVVWAAAKEGHRRILRCLVEHYKADINYRSKTGELPLYGACAYGSLTLVRYPTQAGATLNDEFYSPLIAAVNIGYIELVEYLVINGASVNLLDKNNASPLYVASKNEFRDITELLKKEQQ